MNLQNKNEYCFLDLDRCGKRVSELIIFTIEEYEEIKERYK